MAIGLTKLEMLNQVMEAITLPPASSLPSAGSDTTSIYARGEDLLDRVGREVVSRGWAGNFVHGKELTAADVGSGVFKIDLDTAVNSSNVLQLECIAPGRYAGRLSINGQYVWIMDEGTDDFGSAVSVYCHLVLSTTLENMAPRVKEVIAAVAAQEFQRRQKGSVTQDAYLRDLAQRLDMLASHERPNIPVHPPFNQRPLTSSDEQRGEPQR